MLKNQLLQPLNQKTYLNFDPKFTKQKCFRFQQYQCDKSLPSLKLQTHKQIKQLQIDIIKIQGKKKMESLTSEIAATERYAQTRKWVIQRGKQNLLDFSEEELTTIKKYFNQLDSDKSGNIGLEELQSPFISLGIVENIQQVEQILNEVDKSGNGQIEFIEFLQFIKKTKNHQNNNYFKDTIRDTQNHHDKMLSFQTLVTQRRRQKFLGCLLLFQMQSIGKMINYNPKDREL